MRNRPFTTSTITRSDDARPTWLQGGVGCLHNVDPICTRQDEAAPGPSHRVETRFIPGLSTAEAWWCTREQRGRLVSVADFAVLSASIRTLDENTPVSTAVAARRGTIVCVGSDAEVRDVCDASTTIVDGRGMHLVPGLVDAHIHPFWPELSRGANLTDCVDLATLRTALAKEHVEGQTGWVLGRGVEYGAFEGQGISGELLADAVGGAPALVVFMDGHTAVATPRALELAGIVGGETFSDESEVVLVDGVPTGELRELSAIDLVTRVVPPLSDRERYDQIVSLQQRLVAVGLTGVHAMDGEPAIFSQLREMEARGDLLTRAVVPLWQKPEMSMDEMRAQLPEHDARGVLWRCGVAKFFIDGVIDTGTGWLDEPDVYGAGIRPLWPEPDRYHAAVRLFAQAGWQCVTHAIGDRAVRASLDAYRAAGVRRGLRHRVEHLEVVKDAEVQRFAPEGVVASMQPLHMQWRTAAGDDAWSTRLGPERIARAWRTGDVLRTGACLALGSDWPVASFDPLLGMAWARLRRRPGEPDRLPWEPHQRLTPEQALRGYTSAPAAAVSEQSATGRIAPGFRADLTGLGADPVACPADELPDVAVRLTVVDGRAVYHRD